jgi:hypothetical protein
MSKTHQILSSNFSDIKSLDCYIKSLIDIAMAEALTDAEIKVEDTASIDLQGTGKSATPLKAVALISPQPDNDIAVLPDGLYTSGLVKYGVVSGGEVTWTGGYGYHVSPAIYYINKVKFDQTITNPAGFDFVLTAPSPLYNRLDSFVLNNLGLTVVLAGAPSNNPALAPLNTATQLFLSCALVEVSNIGTAANRVAIATPVPGMEFIQTDDVRDAPAGKYYYANGRWNYLLLNPEQLVYAFEDFLLVGGNGVSTNRFFYAITGSATPTGLYANRPGAVVFSTAAINTGRVTLYAGSLNNSSGGLYFTGGACYFKCSTIDFPILSTVGEEFTIRVGLGFFGAGGLSADLDGGVYFEYNRLTSANWLLRTAKNAVRTTLDSLVPVATGTILFEIFVNAAATQADYYINDVLVGSVTPLAFPFVVFGSPIFQLMKSAGTTPRTITLDYIKAWQRLTVIRP